ncbi:MAG TPA: energy transducer TonB [Terriglobales bacterium]|nr:energy transducer TonB [Terriglobales bacterium]
MKVTRILLALTLTLSLSSIAFTQNVASGADHRKITKRTTPIYPELAKRMGVSGSVKLELAVASSGKVKEVKIIGGHPVLALSAKETAENWQFEAGAESTELVIINFTR